MCLLKIKLSKISHIASEHPMSEEVHLSDLNALLIPLQKTQKKLNVSYLETGIDQPHI